MEFRTRRRRGRSIEVTLEDFNTLIIQSLYERDETIDLIENLKEVIKDLEQFVKEKFPEE